MTFDNGVELALAAACEELEMARKDMVRLILREWLETYGFLPFQEPDEDGQMKGSA
ncbi:hypothetical protein ACMFL9_26460 [Sinorhizobium meliloti]